jgi:hypothetical protein
MFRKLLATAYLVAVLGGIASAYTFNYSYPVMNETFLENWFTQYTKGVGYATGQGTGCSVTQITTRTTTVICNGPTGQITLLAAAGSATPASFTVTNSTIEANDVIVLNQQSTVGANLYELFVTAVAAGSFKVTFFTTAGTTSDSPLINFAVIKGSAN